MRSKPVRSVVGAAALVFLLVAIQHYNAAAANMDQRRNGPKIGTSVGALFSVEDQSGAVRDFRSLRGKRGLILLFSHSFDW